MGATKRIFISYPREREAEAIDWRLRLQQRGHSAYVCHVDEQRSFTALHRTTQVTRLKERIANTDAVLVLWDRNYGRAAWCAWELREALQSSNKHVLVCSQDATVTPRTLRHRTIAIETLEDVELALEQKVAPPMRVTGLTLFPAASLLESRVAPAFEAKVRTAREIATLILQLALCIACQVAIYRLARPWMTSDMRQHTWSLITAVHIAMTIIGALTVSLYASVAAGLVGLAVSLAALAGGIAHWGEPSTTGLTIATVAAGTFHLTLSLLFRDRLLGESWALRGNRRTSHRTLRGHLQAAAGVLAISLLLLVGIALVDFAITYVTQHRDDHFEVLRIVFQIPIVLGGMVGGLVGVPLGIAVYRRWLGNYRATATRGIAVSVVLGVLAFALVTLAGYCLGRWISMHIVAAISALGGSYAGGQVGILLAVGAATPIALGTSRLSPQAERLWAVVGAGAVIGLVALKVRSFPFAAHRDGVPWEILRGAIIGAAPVLTIRSTATAAAWIRSHRNEGRRTLPWAIAIVVHVTAIALAGAFHSAMPASHIDLPPSLLQQSSTSPAAAGGGEPVVVELHAVEPGPQHVTVPPPPPGPPGRATPTPPQLVEAPHDAGAADAIAVDAATPIAAELDATTARSDAAIAVDGVGSATNVSAADSATTVSAEAGSGATAGAPASAVGSASAGSASESAPVGAGAGTGSGTGSGPSTGSGSAGSATDGSGSGSAPPPTGPSTETAPPASPPTVPPLAAPQPAAGIAVVQASYGTNCGAPAGNATPTLVNLCDGQKTCAFVANNALFGDPKPYCPKDFLAEWRCGSTAFRTAAVSPRKNEGYAIVLSCPE